MMLNGGELDGVRILSPKTVELFSVRSTSPSCRRISRHIRRLGAVADEWLNVAGIWIQDLLR